jgi:hypothetical protein
VRIAVGAIRIGQRFRADAEDRSACPECLQAGRCIARSAAEIGSRASALPATTESRVAAVLDRRREQVHGRRAHEVGDEEIGRVVVDLGRRAELLDLAIAHHGDLGRQRHRLDLVVGDIDDRGAGGLACRRLISMRMSTRSLASRLDSGSSNRNSFGSRTSARPMATRWRWPPESWLGLRSKQVADLQHLGHLVDRLLALIAAGTPRISMPKEMFPATVMFG